MVAALFCLGACLGCQSDSAGKKSEIETVDVDKDGRPDVTYYRKGKYIAKTETDTNEDGKPDIVVHNIDGKFEWAEVDSDYDGTFDRTFTDEDEFKKWLKENRVQSDERLWQFTLFKF
jgi:hypothetical protein